MTPATALTLYQIQGMTADPGLIAHFSWSRGASKQTKWLIVYVLLSRPRSLKALRSVGLNEQVRSLIEGGPPDEVVGEFETIFRDKINATHKAASEVVKRWNW